MSVDNTQKQRKSNLELFRIITMFIIVAHHYVVNSPLIGLVHEEGKVNFNSIFLLLFGWGGKRELIVLYSLQDTLCVNLISL